MTIAKIIIAAIIATTSFVATAANVDVEDLDGQCIMTSAAPLVNGRVAGQARAVKFETLISTDSATGMIAVPGNNGVINVNRLRKTWLEDGSKFVSYGGLRKLGPDTLNVTIMIGHNVAANKVMLMLTENNLATGSSTMYTGACSIK